MTKDEAIHKALKVLNCLNNDRVYETAWVKGAINACEEALEQPEQLSGNSEQLKQDHSAEKNSRVEQPAQEPVAWTDEYKYFLEWDKKSLCDKAVCKEHEAIPLYTHPYQWQGNKEFVGLTDEERYLNDGRTPEEIEYAIAIEQALKDKNT